MRRILVTLPFLLLAASCGSAPTTPMPTSKPSVGPTVTMISAAPSPSDPAAVDPAPTGYLGELRVIDPRLAEDEQRAVSRGENTCADLRAGEFSDSQLVARIQERFSGGDLQLDAEQAHRVLDAVRRRLCDAPSAGVEPASS